MHTQENNFLPTRSRIDSLDGLRGLAVLFVLLSHLSNAGLHLLPFLSFSGIGKVGVWLFFLLSSFLLTLQLLEKSNRDLIDSKTWTMYFERRFLRIYPLFVFVMTGSYFLKDLNIFPPFAAPSSYADLLNRLLLIDAKGIEWSILVEFRFYFLLPFIALFVVFITRRALLPTSACFILGIAFWSYFSPPPSLVAILPYLSIFLTGCFTAYCHWWLKKKSLEISSKNKIYFELSAGVAFIVILSLTPSIWSVFVGHHIPLDYFHNTLTPFAILWGIFLFGQLWGQGSIRKILCSKPLRFLGAISFSVYLIHPPIIKIVSDHVYSDVPPAIQAMLVITIVVLLSCATYSWIERPFLSVPLRRKAPPASTGFSLPD